MKIFVVVFIGIPLRRDPIEYLKHTFSWRNKVYINTFGLRTSVLKLCVLKRAFFCVCVCVWGGGGVGLLALFLFLH